MPLVSRPNVDPSDQIAHSEFQHRLGFSHKHENHMGHINQDNSIEWSRQRIENADRWVPLEERLQSSKATKEPVKEDRIEMTTIEGMDHPIDSNTMKW